MTIKEFNYYTPELTYFKQILNNHMNSLKRMLTLRGKR